MLSYLTCIKQLFMSTLFLKMQVPILVLPRTSCMILILISLGLSLLNFEKKDQDLVICPNSSNSQILDYLPFSVVGRTKQGYMKFFKYKKLRRDIKFAIYDFFRNYAVRYFLTIFVISVIRYHPRNPCSYKYHYN